MCIPKQLQVRECSRTFSFFFLIVLHFFSLFGRCASRQGKLSRTSKPLSIPTYESFCASSFLLPHCFSHLGVQIEEREVQPLFFFFYHTKSKRAHEGVPARACVCVCVGMFVKSVPHTQACNIPNWEWVNGYTLI